MDARQREILHMGDKLFAQRTGLLNLWQDIAENFYPQRANFTTTIGHGDLFAENLSSSFPVLANRELSNLVATMLRPRATRWFALHAMDDKLDDALENRAFLEFMSDRQWRAMYHPRAQFIRATKEADGDFVPFGQAVIHVEVDWSNGPPTLLHTCRHLRDCAWSENASGTVDVMHRKWEPTARQLKQKFGDKVHAHVTKMCTTDKNPDGKVNCRHVVVPSRIYEYETKGGRKFPYVSLFIDCDNEHVMEEVGLKWFPYVVPRWQTVSGSQYARSMATDIVLPDARVTQAVVWTLREAGEKFVDPPLIATDEVVRSDINIGAGGITIVDKEYDEKLGAALRPLTQDKSGFPISFEIARALQDDIRHGFFLDKIQLPDIDTSQMTAFEVRRRIEEHVRSAAPLFEPIEQEYNLPLVELDFMILREIGAFGDMSRAPEALKSAETEFRFDSPLKDMEDRGKAAIFAEGLQAVLGPASQIDPALMKMANLEEAARDSLRGIGWLADWLNPNEAVTAEREKIAKAQNMERGMSAIQQAADAGKGVGEASAALEQAGLV